MSSHPSLEDRLRKHAETPHVTGRGWTITVTDVQKPSVGRVVHYVAYGTPGGEFPAGVCRCALITETYGPHNLMPDMSRFSGNEVGLVVLNPTGQFFNRYIPYDPEKGPGTWHWPERV